MIDHKRTIVPSICQSPIKKHAEKNNCQILFWDILSNSGPIWQLTKRSITVRVHIYASVVA